MLRDVEQMSIEEVSQALDISTASVKTRLLRARLMLRDMLAPKLTGGWFSRTFSEREQAMVVSCEQVWQEISNYLDGDVSPELRAAMEEHFANASIAPQCWKARRTLSSCMATIVW